MQINFCTFLSFFRLFERFYAIFGNFNRISSKRCRTEVKANNYTLSPFEAYKRIAEEWIAYIAELRVQSEERSRLERLGDRLAEVLDRLVEALRRFLRKIPKFAHLRYTRSELEGIILAAAKNIRNGNRRFNGKSVEQNGRFAIIGEEGAANLDRYLAQNNLGNLRTAKEMLDAGKDAKTIKLSTGWEKGGDGKWRMEVPDIKMKNTRLFLGKKRKFILR